MKDIKVLLTACGCPGAAALIKWLKNNGERKIEIIGTDMNERAIGKFFADNFYKIPSGSSPDYIQSLLRLIEIEKPDVLLPESSYEVYPISLHKKEIESMGTKVLVSNSTSTELSLNKYKTYECLKSNGINVPKYFKINNLSDLVKYADILGYPYKKIVAKQPVSKGSRGLKIFTTDIDNLNLFINKKPGESSIYSTLEDFQKLAEKFDTFPELILMEYIEGKQYVVDSIAFEGKTFLSTARVTEQAKEAILEFRTINNPELIKHAQEIIKIMNLDYFVNIQFKGNEIMEVHPRVSTFIYQENMIIPYLAIKYILGEISEEELKNYEKNIEYGRTTFRYYDQIFFRGEENV